MTKEELRNVRAIIPEIKQLQKKIQSLRELAGSLHSLSADVGGISRNAISDPTAKAAEKIFELEQLYINKLALLTERKTAAEQAIESLNPKLRQLMRLYYLDGLTWESVSAEMHYSYVQVYRMHRQALELLKN